MVFRSVTFQQSSSDLTFFLIRDTDYNRLEKGSTMLEYAMLLSLVCLGMLGVLGATGMGITGTFADASYALCKSAEAKQVAAKNLKIPVDGSGGGQDPMGGCMNEFSALNLKRKPALDLD